MLRILLRIPTLNITVIEMIGTLYFTTYTKVK